MKGSLHQGDEESHIVKTFSPCQTHRSQALLQHPESDPSLEDSVPCFFSSIYWNPPLTVVFCRCLNDHVTDVTKVKVRGKNEMKPEGFRSISL